MRRSPQVDLDEGFTLIELLIAMMIMTVAVAVLVTAMGTVITATSQHRGQAIEEALARNYGEAIQQKAQFTTTLTAAVSDSAMSIPVADAKGLQLSTPFYVVIAQEAIQVKSVSATTLTVQQRGAGGSIAVSHASGAVVTPLVSCPGGTDLAPDNAHFTQPVEATAAITVVEYWEPSTGSFTQNQGTCANHFTTVCAGGDIRPECDIGLERVTVAVTINSAYKSRFHDPSTTTQVLIRRGST